MDTLAKTLDRKDVRVLIVDDHRIVRVGVRALLDGADHIDIVGEAATAHSALAILERLQPDVVLMDIRLPDRSGIDLCRDMIRVLPVCRVLFLTALSDESVLADAIGAGGSGLLLKDSQEDCLVDAIERVALGECFVDHALTGSLISYLQENRHSEVAGELSWQEERILEALAEGRTNKEIGLTLGLSEKTVRNYVSHIFLKLGVSRRTEAAVTFYKRRLGDNS